MKKDVNISQLATCTMFWLNYTSAIGREYVLTESALKFPIAEYLEKSSEIEIKLEYSHPRLFKKRFDLYYKNASKEEFAFEFKYIKNGSTRDTAEKQRIFDDLMRLYLFLEKKRRSYFLICGNQFSFKSDFESIISKPNSNNQTSYITPQIINNTAKSISPSGFYKEWFSFDVKQPVADIDLTTQSQEYKPIYDAFVSDYQNSFQKKSNKKLKMPKKITTNLVFLSEQISTEGIANPSRVGIWEITKNT